MVELSGMSYVCIMSTRSQDRFELALRSHTHGSTGAETAVELLVHHGSWLHRCDFLDRLVEYGNSVGGTAVTDARVVWDRVPAFLVVAGCSADERSILLLAAELAGTDTGVALWDLLGDLDTTSAEIVADALRTVLRDQR